MAMLPKRPKGVLSKGQGASNFVPGVYSKTGKDKFQDVVSAAIDTAETQKDRANIKSVIYSAGRKYKVDAAVVQKAAKAAEKMYAKPKPASKKVSNGSDTKPYNTRLIKPEEIIKDKPKAKAKTTGVQATKKAVERAVGKAKFAAGMKPTAKKMTQNKPAMKPGKNPVIGAKAKTTVKKAGKK